MVLWVDCFQNFALAAAAAKAAPLRLPWFLTVCAVLCKVWSYESSQAHLRICLRIAAEQRGDLLAQLYDESCRKEWGERALRGAP